MKNQQCRCTKLNCSHHIPENEGLDNNKDWGKGFATKVLTYVKLHKQYGKVLLQDLPDLEEYNRGEYSIDDFLCDTFAGDLPWNKKDSDEVLEVAKNIEGYNDSVTYLENLVKTQSK